MGIAVGCVGMSRRDFCECYFDEFESIFNAWHDMREGRQRDAWERVRTLGAICIQPHIKNRVTPQKLLPMPWDKKAITKKETPKLTAEEKRKRFEELVHRLGDEMNM